LGDEVGRGGFGVVYRARQVDLNRPSALKVLHAHATSEDSRRRFARECRVIGSLRPHPSIVTVYQTGQTDAGEPFLAMEYLPGGTLAQRMPLPAGDARRIAIAVADALAVAHAGGVVHRDVKPANVLFAENGTPVLVDFGIASLVGDASTATGAIAMSLGYAPPEVLDGERVDVPADVYGLGATLFAALTGRAPFSGSGESGIAIIAIRIATRPVDDLRPQGVPDALCRVIETAMAKDPAQRYGSMTEMRDALVAADVGDESDVETIRLSQVPAVASVAALAGVAGRSRRQRRAVLATAAAVALSALLAGGAWALSGSDSPASHKALTKAAQTPASATPTASVAPKRAAKTVRTHSAKSASSAVPAGGPGPIGNGPIPGAQGAGPYQAPTVQRSQPGPGTAPAQILPALNRTPTLAAISGQQNNEQSFVNLHLQGSDPDGDPLTYSAVGLPAGLTISSSSGFVSGTVAVNAANATTDRRNGLKYQSFNVTMRVTDGKATASRSLTWQILDGYRIMPNYYGKYGCNGDPNCQESVPNVSAISVASFFCSTSGSIPPETILAQSVSAGSVIRWGQAITYTYHQTSC